MEQSRQRGELWWGLVVVVVGGWKMVWGKDPNESSDGKIRLGSLIWVNQRTRHKNNENRIDEQTETEKVEKVGCEKQFWRWIRSEKVNREIKRQGRGGKRVTLFSFV